MLLFFPLTDFPKENIIYLMKINISKISIGEGESNDREILISKKAQPKITSSKVPVSDVGTDVPNKSKIGISIKKSEGLDSSGLNIKVSKKATPSEDNGIVLIGKDNLPVKDKVESCNNRNVAILIAEDEKPLSRALEIKLSKEGYKVSIATNGDEAISLLDKGRFGLVILDLVMPKKDGFAVLEHLKDKGKTMEIIVLSNLAQEEDFKKAKDLGAKTYFIKSNTPIIELVKYIRENI
jgi:CheY-like chemotaxis protein